MPDTEFRIKKLEEEMDSACKDLKAILTNHLPHIQVELERVKTEARIYGAIIMIALAAVIGLVVSL